MLRVNCLTKILYLAALRVAVRGEQAVGTAGTASNTKPLEFRPHFPLCEATSVPLNKFCRNWGVPLCYLRQWNVLCIEYGGLWFFFQHNMGLSLLLWASCPVLMYLECSTSHLSGGSNGCIPVGLSHLFFAGQRGREKRVTGRTSETSFACVNIAVIEIGDSSWSIDSYPTLWIGDFCQTSV